MEKFGQLLFENTPKGIAKLASLCIVNVLYHKASTALSRQYIKHIEPHLETLFNWFATRANNKDAFSLATQGFGGEKMALSENEFLTGFSDTMKKGICEEMGGGIALTQAEEMGAEAGAKISEGGEKIVRGTTDIENAVLGRMRTGSATKMDPHHAFPNLVDNYVGIAEKFDIPTKGPGGIIVRQSELYQIEGSLNGASGVFEWIVDQDYITHRRFIPNGKVTGSPNQIPKKS